MVKIRLGFVNNSSSASFLLVSKKAEDPLGEVKTAIADAAMAREALKNGLPAVLHEESSARWELRELRDVIVSGLEGSEKAAVWEHVS
jgi:hypothetical protein